MSGTETDHSRVTSARPEMTAALMARTGLDEGMLTELVYNFYDKVRSDAMLGPIFAAHIVEIWIWAIFYFFVEEIQNWESALYFSTSSFTTVGYGDLVLSEEWRLLESIEAINGMILFGWSTAFIFAGVRRIYGHLYRGEEPHLAS